MQKDDMIRKEDSMSQRTLLKRGADFGATHFLWAVEKNIGSITLNRPEKKNPLTFESYRELIDLFNFLHHADDVRCVIISGAGGNFCSGGDVHEIIGPLVTMKDEGRTADLLRFTRMTGDLVLAMRQCPQPVISAIDGICAGAGAIIAMASDFRYGTAESKVAFLFTRVGLSGADMGACAILPRLIGQGRASELLYTGRFMSAEEAERWGFYNSIVSSSDLLDHTHGIAARISSGPTFAHSITKKALHHEWAMTVDEAIEAEAQAQALCMQTNDFARAFHAFAAKERPVFKGD